MPGDRPEASDTFLSGPAVDVRLVVVDRVEPDEGGSLGMGSSLQVIIEKSLPGVGVDAGRTRRTTPSRSKRKASSSRRSMCSGGIITPARGKRSRGSWRCGS